MTTDPRKRWAVLGTLLAATLAAVMFVQDEGSDSAGTRPPREHRVGAAPTVPASTVRSGAAETVPDAINASLAISGQPPREEDPEATDEPATVTHDPFRVTSWVITPPPPPAPEPTAPPLPFKYLGKIVDDGRHIVFLSDKNRYLVAREGDRIDGWRIESIYETRMSFLYEPLKKRQELAIGD